MPVEVFVPANFVSADWGTPTVCARHGEPAAERRRTRFASHTSRWLYLLGVVVYFIAVAASSKVVWAPAWPFCARCEKEHASKTAAGWGGGVLGVLIWVFSRSLPHDVAPVGAIIGVLLFIAGVIVAGRGGRLAITGGVVTDDGQAVRFARAHETFASQAAAAQQAAMQHFATQQAHPAQPSAGPTIPTQAGPGQPHPAQPAVDAYPKEQPPAAV